MNLYTKQKQTLGHRKQTMVMKRKGEGQDRSRRLRSTNYYV